MITLTSAATYPPVLTSASITQLAHYTYPDSPKLCAAIEREIMAEVMTCPRCARAWAEYRLIMDCPECGAHRDPNWWEHTKRIAGEGVGK